MHINTYLSNTFHSAGHRLVGLDGLQLERHSVKMRAQLDELRYVGLRAVQVLRHDANRALSYNYIHNHIHIHMKST
jgi:hypothetical protein